MTFSQMDIGTFSGRLASKSAVPGGGGASALVAALGGALCCMVCNLTIGKASYAEYEKDNKEILDKAIWLYNRLLELIDEDARAFEPLSKAYSIPKDDPGRDQVMERCLKDASAAPMKILRLSCETVELHSRLLGRSSALAVSDIGTGVTFCRAAMQGAAINVRINTGSMKDAKYAAGLDAQVQGLLDEYMPKADRVYNEVWEKLK